MNPFVLYLHLLKATLTTLAGLASLPVLQADLVQHHHVLTNKQLNVAIVVTRSTPGPAGLYVVSVGYFVDGFWGAVAAREQWSRQPSSPWSCFASWGGERSTLAQRGRSRASSSPGLRCCGSPLFRLAVRPSRIPSW